MSETSRELLLLGIGDVPGRGDTVTSYLTRAGYRLSSATLPELPER